MTAAVQVVRSQSTIMGVICGLAAVSIWAGFIIVSRAGVQSSLTPWDIAAIRFGVAGVLLAPYLMHKGLAWAQLGWLGVVAIVIGCGVPSILLVSAGLLFAPAAHAGALFPGMMPLMVVILSVLILNEELTTRRTCGVVLTVMGAVLIVWGAGGTIGMAQTVGHALFLTASLAWAGYTVAMRQACVGGLHAAALAAVCSLVLYLPAYLYFVGFRLFRASPSDVMLQVIVQGVLAAIVALLLYGRMVAILGATRGAAFVALTPAATAILAIPALSEVPTITDWISIALIAIGVYAVSGGAAPRRRD